MPIEMKCACGRKSVVADEHAGRRGKCPACGIVLRVPQATAAAWVATSPLPLHDVLPIGADAGAGLVGPDADLADRLKRAAPPPAPTPAVVPDPPGFVRYEVTQPPPRPADPRVQDVRVVDASMPFESMCWLVFKWTMAAIPTMLLLWFVSWLIRLIK